MNIQKIASFEEFLAEVDNNNTSLLHHIGYVNWPEQYPYDPGVAFAIAHNGSEIFLKFIVNEKYTMARTAEDNGPVWTDSCVEFFISFDDTGYYNFEFNCIGTALLGFRKLKSEATHASPAIMKSIYRKSTPWQETFDEVEGDNVWELDVRIPVTALFKHNFKSLDGIIAKANFYKCGDDLTVPHFLSWNKISTPSPNFHCEEFFGRVEFGK